MRRRRRRGCRWLALGPAAVPGGSRFAVTVRPYAASLVAAALSSLTGWALTPWVALDSLVMVYLVGVVVVAARYGRGPSIVAAVAGSVAFDFFFTLPFFSLRIADPRLVITVGVMLLVGLVISELTTALRARGHAAVDHARRVAVLYSLTRDLARAADEAQIYQAARRQITRATGRDVFFFKPTGSAAQVLVAVDHVSGDADPADIEIAHWVFLHRSRAGSGTTHQPGAQAIYLPLVAGGRSLGVMMVRPRSPGTGLAAVQARFLGHCARQVAGAMERQRLVRAAQTAERTAEEEQLRHSLLASVSHDLRQPLMVIEAAASTLLEAPDAPVNPIYSERVLLLVAEARQMSDSVNKILDMTRLESGPVQLDRRWHLVETLVLGALNRLRGRLAEHVVVPTLPTEPLWVYVDALVFEKLLTNLLENAAKYSQPGSAIWISAGCSRNVIAIRVTDEGCGLPAGDTEAVFRKFHRGNQRNSVPGMGLGLPICRAIAALHGGRISAHRRPTAGAEFVVELPIIAGAPAAHPDLENAAAS